MIQNTIANQYIPNLKRTFGNANQTEKKPSKERDSNNKVMIGGAIAAIAAIGIAVVAIKSKNTRKTIKEVQKTTENTLSALEKEVFEPLKNFKGTNTEFAEKAYALLIKHKGIEDIAPKLEFAEESWFDDVTGKLALGFSHINNGSHGDILNILDHESDHFIKYKDIMNFLGKDKFFEIADENLSKIIIELQVKELIFDPTEKAALKKQRPNLFLNKAFWTNIAIKRKGEEAKDLDYDIEVIVEYYRTRNWEEIKLKKNSNEYNSLKNYAKYLNYPIEKTALETGYKTQKAWDEYLIKNNLEPPANTFEDRRPEMKLFEKIDNYLCNNFSEDKRAEEYEKLCTEVAPQLDNNNNDFMGLYTKILENLKAKNKLS